MSGEVVDRYFGGDVEAYDRVQRVFDNDRPDDDFCPSDDRDRRLIDAWGDE